MAYAETQTGVTYDELCGGTAISAMTKNITLGTAAAAALARGTLLKVDGTVCAKSEVASYILVKDVAVDDTVITVYSRGLFNAEKLVAQSGDTVRAHEEELRKVGIYLTALK